MTQETALLIK